MPKRGEEAQLDVERTYSSRIAIAIACIRFAQNMYITMCFTARKAPDLS
jgi:hypothetical protein